LKVAESFEIKMRTVIILIIGALIMLALSYACVLDWINKIETGQDWAVNLWYHPLTGVISIMFFTLFVVFLFEKVSSGQIKKIKDYLEANKTVNLIVIIISVVSLILLLINSIMLLDAGTSGVESLVIFHTLMGITFGVGIMVLILKPLFTRFMNEPEKYQKYLLIIVIISIIIFSVIVIIGRAIGLISI
jgi:hypothetical protein